MRPFGLRADAFQKIQALGVESFNRHFGTTPLQFSCELIQGRDTGLVPNVHCTQINGDLGGMVMHVEPLEEIALLTKNNDR